MIHDAIILTALGPLVDDKVWGVVFPQEKLPEWPAIRFTPVGGSISADVCNGGDADTDDIQVQFDYVAKTYQAAGELCAQGRTALQAIDQPGLHVAAVSPEVVDYDPETKTYRATQDFIFSGSSID